MVFKFVTFCGVPVAKVKIRKTLSLFRYFVSSLDKTGGRKIPSRFRLSLIKDGTVFSLFALQPQHRTSRSRLGVSVF
jgi:hypothetical protein